MSPVACVCGSGGNVAGLPVTSPQATAPPPPSSIGSPSASKNATCSKLWPGLGASCATTRTCLVDCTSVAFLDDRKAVGEHVPAVDDLQSQGDLVLPLQVALTIGVTEPDQLDREGALHAPPDAGGEIADDRADPGVGRLRAARDGVGHRRGQAPEVGDPDTETQLRVLLAVVGVAGGRQRPRVRGVERDPG